MNKVVLITGCSSGLGYYLCEELNKNGYTVIASARNIEKLKNISASMKLQIDVTDNNSIVNGINKIINRYEKIDVLINNAGFSIRGAIEEVNLSDVKELFNVNVFGLINMIQMVLPIMRNRKSGKIINIGSISGKFAQALNGNYCASKYAVEAISDALRLELHDFNIQSTVIEPGAMNTNFFNNLESTSNKLMKNSNSPYNKLYIKDINYRKIQTRAEISTAVDKIIKIINKQKLKPRYKIVVENKMRFLLTLPDNLKEFLLLHH